MNKSVAERPRSSASKQLKNLYRRARNSGEDKSMKEWVESSMNGAKNDEIADLISRWRYNKRTNFKRPTLGVGSTRKKQGQVKKK